MPQIWPLDKLSLHQAARTITGIKITKLLAQPFKSTFDAGRGNLGFGVIYYNIGIVLLYGILVWQSGRPWIGDVQYLPAHLPFHTVVNLTRERQANLYHTI